MRDSLKRFVRKFPEPVQIFGEVLWRGYRWRYAVIRRSVGEFLQRYRTLHPDQEREHPYVVYMTGMPRTGSSLMKNFLGDHSGLAIMPFQPRGFHISWKASVDENGPIYIDKSTHYIRYPDRISAVCGTHLAFCCIVRDPRDQLVSLFEFERHPELKRDERFWRAWVSEYAGFLSFAAANPEIGFFLLRYEDLVRNPTEAKSAFLTWLGILPDGTDLEATYEIAHAEEYQDDKVRMTRKFSTTSIGRHTRVQDPSARKVIEAYLTFPPARTLMERFGYLPQLGRVPPTSFDNMTVFDRDENFV